MELKLILTLARRWAWLLIIGGIIGTGVGYYYSSIQVPVYQSATKLMISSSPVDTYYSRYTTTLGDQQLARTYSQLFTTDAVLNAVSAHVGYPVSGGQIRVSQQDNSQIIDIVVQDTDKQQAMDIANALVVVFNDYAEELEAGSYMLSEQAITVQIEQTQARITDIEEELGVLAESSQKNQLQELQDQIIAFESSIPMLQEEIQLLEQTINSPTLIQERSVARYQKELELEVMEAKYKNQLEIFIAGITEEQTGDTGNTFVPPDINLTESEVNIRALQREIVQLKSEILALSSPELTEQQLELVNKNNELKLQEEALSTYREAYLQSLLGIDGGPTSSDQQRASQLQTSLSLYQQIYTSLLPSYEAVRLARLQNTTKISQIAVASPGSATGSSNSFVLLGAVVGLLLAGTIAFTIEYLDDTIKTPGDIAERLRLTPLGIILQDKAFETEDGVYVRENPRSPISEAYRVLRTNLEFTNVDNALTTLVITSPQPGDGKSTVAVNLATTIAQSGKRVVLIDADLHRPSLRRVFSNPNGLGLSDLFRGQPLKNVLLSTKTENLRLIQSGSLPPNPAELLSSEQMSTILNELKLQADMIILDAPPLLLSDPSVLSTKVDGTLLVLNAGKTSATVAQSAIKQLARVNANVIGAVLNRLSHRAAEYSGYYYKYYGSDNDGDGSGKGQGNREKKRHKKNSRLGKQMPALGKMPFAQLPAKKSKL